MGKPRFRSAVTPVRRSQGAPRLHAPSVAEVVAAERPAEPLHCLRPRVIAETARRFLAAFPGEVLYAVKCNPDPAVLRAVAAGGIRHFDVASPAEIRLVRQLLPDAALHYMHPVKGRAAIRAAYQQHGVRDFALDSADELAKILDETDGADDLGLIVRLAMPKSNAVYDLSGKFGAPPADAAALLRAARPHARRLGLCFHVGSQCMEPGAYAAAIAMAGEVLAEAGVALDVLDLGGGFPVSYPGLTPPPLGAYMASIDKALAALRLPASCAVWCEPGRALVAPGGSVVVRVEARRGDALFVNDGIYGSLSDAGVPGFRFPVRLIRPEGESDAPAAAFSFFGPTCDSADRMAGPFLLPADVREGDFIEVGQLGAYSACLRTPFNGFDVARLVEVRDPPLLATPGYEPVREAA